MIAKTTIGSTISSALAYGAGELGERSRQQKAEKVDLLATYNLSAQPGDTPKQVHSEIADEMKAVVRDHAGRCKNPVWHTSLSLPANETLDVQAWTKAVDIYLKAVGIDTAQHQVAVFRHRDTAHDHVHIYANRIAMDGGAAVKTGWNYALNFKATRQIEQELALTPLMKESKRTSLKDHDPGKQAAREVVSEALKNVLQRDKPTDLDELVSDLEKHRITAKIASNVNGPCGISFQADGHQAVKGTAVGYKFNQLSVLLEANRAEYQAEIERLQQERNQAEKSRQEAERERDKADNQQPIVQITTKIKEVRVSDPKDKERIERLEKENNELKTRLQTAEKLQSALKQRYNIDVTIAQVQQLSQEQKLFLPAQYCYLKLADGRFGYNDLTKIKLDVIKGVATNIDQRAALLAGESVLLKGLIGSDNTVFDAHVRIDPEKMMLATKRISSPSVAVQANPKPLLTERLPRIPSDQADPIVQLSLAQTKPVASKFEPVLSEPEWHKKLREVLKDIRRSPGLTMQGYNHVDIKKNNKVVDVKIIHNKTKESVLLSEFAPDSTLMKSFGQSKGQSQK